MQVAATRAPVRLSTHPTAAEAGAGANPLDGLPAPAGQIFGPCAKRPRRTSWTAFRNALSTITGPGGIGKTTVALAVASQLAATYPDSVRFVDLSALVDPALVSGKVASAHRSCKCWREIPCSTWSPHCGTAGCWWCSTIANTLSRR